MKRVGFGDLGFGVHRIERRGTSVGDMSTGLSDDELDGKKMVVEML